MKFDLTKGLIGLDGTKITADGTEETRHMTLADACAAALLKPFDPEFPRSVDETVRRFRLAGQMAGLAALSVVDMTAEDVVLIKDAVNEMFCGSIVAGQILVFFETAAPSPTKRRR